MAPAIPPADDLLPKKMGKLNAFMGLQYAKFYNCTAGQFDPDEEKMAGECMADLLRELGIAENTIVKVSSSVVVLVGLHGTKLAQCQAFARREAELEAAAKKRATTPAQPAAAGAAAVPASAPAPAQKSDKALDLGIAHV